MGLDKFYGPRVVGIDLGIQECFLEEWDIHKTVRSVPDEMNQMLKQVQRDVPVRFSSSCHPELVSGSRLRASELRYQNPVLWAGSLSIMIIAFRFS